MSGVVTIDLGEPPAVRFLHSVAGRMGRERRHRLPELWQLHCYDYAGPCWIGDERYELLPGAVTLIPPDTPSRYLLPATVRYLVAHFAVSGSRGDRRAASAPVTIPTCTAQHPQADRLRADLAAAIVCGQSQPARTRALIWSLLWQLAIPSSDDDPLVARARTWIESRLDRQLSLPAIAEHCGCSPNTLIRRFRARLGTTPAAYVRARRVARAQHLLAHVQMAPREVARELGFADLQRFNKVMREDTGRSPRQWRDGGQ